MASPRHCLHFGRRSNYAMCSNRMVSLVLSILLLLVQGILKGRSLVDTSFGSPDPHVLCDSQVSLILTSV